MSQRSAAAHQIGEAPFDLGLGGGADDDVTNSVGILEHPCWLAGDPERGENRAVSVVDIRERQCVTSNKVIDFP